MGPITTHRDRCRKCYSCVRNCPVKAIKVNRDHAEVIHSRCIGCGICIRACAQQAKVIADGLPELRRLLQAPAPTVAVLGCSFPAFFHDIRPGQLVAGIKRLGFDEVHEGAGGVDLLHDDYRAQIAQGGAAPLISSHCPAIVDLIERHYPQLLRNLMGVVSPMIAIGRFIKGALGAETRVVYLSACVAGKFEIDSEQVRDAVDLVLTYAELNRAFKEDGIDLTRLGDSAFDGLPTRRAGRLFPIPGGSLHAFGVESGTFHPEFISTEGQDNALEVIRDLAAGRISPRIVDIRFCNGGCIGGPGRNNRLTTFSKRNLIHQYARNEEIPARTLPHYVAPLPKPLKLRRTFMNKHQRLDLPSGDSIRQILQSTNKFTAGDELDCGACGYATCREHAVAVFQGLAEREMCLPHSLKRLEEDHFNLSQKFELAQRALAQEVGSSAIVGNDPRTVDVLNLIRQVGPTPTTVLIRGESGTGKELTARAIHEHSHRAEKPLVTVNCTTITDSLLESELFGHKKGSFTGATSDKKGLFEAANGGTIFLDEIGDITPKLQAELLRVLDSGEIRPVGGTTAVRVDVRLIAATNKDLEAGIREGWFREDLFYRLNVFTVSMPPLRSRLESLPELVESFRERACQRLNKSIKKVDDRALSAMMRYPWPGNIRELQNIIERAAVLARDSVIRLENLPVVFTELALSEGRNQPQSTSQSFRSQRDRHVEPMEKNLLIHFLREARGNVTVAARQAGIPRRTFYRLLQRHQLSGKDFTPSP